MIKRFYHIEINPMETYWTIDNNLHDLQKMLIENGVRANTVTQYELVNPLDITAQFNGDYFD